LRDRGEMGFELYEIDWECTVGIRVWIGDRLEDRVF
jgi:hypothetical protein